MEGMRVEQTTEITRLKEDAGKMDHEVKPFYWPM